MTDKDKEFEEALSKARKIRKPKNVGGHEWDVECYSWDPDDHGGGFPVVRIDATIYGPKQLDKLIKAALKCREWIAHQAKKHGGEN